MKLLLAIGFVAATALAQGIGSGSGDVVPPPALVSRPIISLSFDDSSESQVSAAKLLGERQLHGVFFVVTGFLNTPWYMTWAEVQQLAAAGNEIGGHTLHHAHLALLGKEDARREICADREALIQAGLRPVGFAYPYGDPGQFGEEMARDCGYSYARIVGGLTPDPGCGSCAAEPLGLEDPLRVRSWVVDSSTTSADLARLVRAAEATGGLVTIVFHTLCDGTCSRWAMPRSEFVAFLDWLAEERDAKRVDVGTIAEAVGAPRISNPGPNRVANPSFVGSRRGIQCWSVGPSGSPHVHWYVARAGHTGNAVLLTSDRQGSAEGSPELTAEDRCAPSVNRVALRVSAWYRSDVAIRLVLRIRELGLWRQWIESAPFAPSATWTQAQIDTPITPATADRVSLSITASNGGAAYVDDAAVAELVPAPTRAR